MRPIAGDIVGAGRGSGRAGVYAGAIVPGEGGVEMNMKNTRTRAIGIITGSRVDALEAAGLAIVDKDFVAIARAMREVLEEILAIVNESRGVAGWHLNGDIAPWDEFGYPQKINVVLRLFQKD